MPDRPDDDFAVDLFAGTGWAVALAQMGRDELGVEYDDAVCATRRAAGFATVQADVSALDPLDFGPVGLLIASPPCQAYSRAGKGAGRADIAHVVACSQELAAGHDTRAEHLARCKDARAMLVVEPLRWALELRPRAVVCEQVPDVLPYWRMVGELLAPLGYSWWAGILECERYGVPQTRERAILIARRDGLLAHPPEPTHRRYVKGEPNGHADELFGDGLLPWVSMAEALGWTDNGSRSRSVKGGAVVVNTRGNRRTPGGNEFSADGPSLALTEKARSWKLRSGQSIAGEGRAERGSDEPCVSVTGRADLCAWVYRAGAQSNQAVRNLAESAPTVAFGHDSARAGFAPADDPSDVAVRVTAPEAAVLQTFPPDFPWQGSRTRVFLQIGNAVPPTLARAVLSTVLR